MMIKIGLLYCLLLVRIRIDSIFILTKKNINVFLPVANVVASLFNIIRIVLPDDENILSPFF